MQETYSIRVYKEYFNFAAAHFMMFEDGTREPLHGHNYRVQLKGKAETLSGDMVFDFLDIKPVVRKICDELDHKLLLPQENALLESHIDDENVKLKTKDSTFVIPKSDVLFLPIKNTSVERLAAYFAKEIDSRVKTQHNFSFTSLEVEVEESPGQSAIYELVKNKRD